MGEVVRLSPGLIVPRNRFQSRRIKLAPLIDLDTLFGQSTAIYIALDMSTSMGYGATSGWIWDDTPEKTRAWAQVTGVVALLRDIQAIVAAGAELQPFTTEDGTEFFTTEDGSEVFATEKPFSTITHDLRIRVYPKVNDAAQPITDFPADFEARNMSPADFDAAIAWVEALRTIAPQGDVTPYDEGVQAAPAFFGATDHTEKALLFFTDGQPFPASTLAAAQTILAPLSDVDVYCYNILLTNTTSTAALDNTPADGVPVLTDLTAQSWGVWSTGAVTTEWIAQPAGSFVPVTRLSSAVFAGLTVHNPSGTPATFKARISSPRGQFALIVEEAIAAGATVALDHHVAGHVLGSDEVLQIGAEIGDVLSCVVDYIVFTKPEVN